MDEFTAKRYDQLAASFVLAYKESKIVAAKMVADAKVPDKDYPILRELINKEFLKAGYTFE
jgi:hypothetical protein